LIIHYLVLPPGTLLTSVKQHWREGWLCSPGSQVLSCWGAFFAKKERYGSKRENGEYLKDRIERGLCTTALAIVGCMRGK
jgi:hypothetical protein